MSVNKKGKLPLWGMFGLVEAFLINWHIKRSVMYLPQRCSRFGVSNSGKIESSLSMATSACALFSAFLPSFLFTNTLIAVISLLLAANRPIISPPRCCSWLASHDHAPCTPPAEVVFSCVLALVLTKCSLVLRKTRDIGINHPRGSQKVLNPHPDGFDNFG